MTHLVPPVVTEDDSVLSGEICKHPAYGVVVMTHPTGHHGAMFGSDVGGSFGCVRIAVHSAELRRSLSRDWIHHQMAPLVEFEMTHAQFAQFITGVGKGEGTPVTLTHAPEDPGRVVPGIAKLETKYDLHRKEIRAAASERLNALAAEVARLEALIESGKTPKAEMRDILSNLKRHVQQTPGSIEFVLKSAEEALENATKDAKIEVEAFIDSRAKSLGLQTLQQLVDMDATAIQPRMLSDNNT